jgi:hypothetical protein
MGAERDDPEWAAGGNLRGDGLDRKHCEEQGGNFDSHRAPLYTVTQSRERAMSEGPVE